MLLSKQSKEYFEKYYGFEYPDGLELDYNFAWCSVDGVIQLLRMDMLPISKRSIDSEIGLLDGRYKEVLQKDGKYLIKEEINE